MVLEQHVVFICCPTNPPKYIAFHKPIPIRTKTVNNLVMLALLNERDSRGYEFIITNIVIVPDIHLGYLPICASKWLC
jgi:hypothetical protein